MKVDEDRGIACKNCGCKHLSVYYTRRHVKKIIRMRQCRHCGRRVRTVERVV